MTKISILLPYKENFSPTYPGAVSLFVKDTSIISKYKKNITVYGNTEHKKRFKIKYFNLDLRKKDLLKSQSKTYVKEFVKEEEKKNSDIIEVHNRPIYVKYLLQEKVKSKIVIYFHNDPLSMSGSKSVNDRKFLLDSCEKIIFNSQWSKKRFQQKINSSFINSEKLLVIYQSAKKSKINITKKLKWITFVGKLNRSKGYDVFGKSLIKILDKYKNWKGIVVGDEQRDKITFNHKNLKILGFLPHTKVLEILEKTSIAVACSRWNEPLGRTSLEGASKGCAVIITNKGGLPETVTNAVIINKLDPKILYNKLKILIENEKLRKKYQLLSQKNFFLTHKKSCDEIDTYRDQLLKLIKFSINRFDAKSLRIIHVTNFNERHDGRLFFNSGRRINNGFIRMGHSVLEFSDRDIQKYYKSFGDLDGSKNLNQKLINTCYNFKPDIMVLGHADSIFPETLDHLKSNYPGLKIAQWFLDPLNKKGPDYNKNKNRVLNKMEFIDTNFLTTSPDVLDFVSSYNNYFYIPNPCDPSFETLNNFNKQCPMDVFYALSHGVHRGVLKRGKHDDRESFVRKLINITPNVKFDVYGLNKIQPIWADNYFKSISNSKMGLNLSRGKPIKYYSSDRITQIIGNGLLTFVDEGIQYRDFFDDDEMIFYKNINDLSEKIQKYCVEDKLRKKIAKNGKEKYIKYFNSELVSRYILEKTYGLSHKKKYIWAK
tara:strand:+ start:19919 stop:22054 length:2136 start_codon:yes stop_codon:yes gene_type:complete